MGLRWVWQWACIPGDGFSWLMPGRPSGVLPHNPTLTSYTPPLPLPGDPGLVGVVAQLGTVDDPQLSAVLAANMRSSLGTVVVADAPARQRLAAALAQQRYGAPDMLPMSLMVGSSGKAGDTPGFASAGERAHALQRVACRGADPPLAKPLPHTARIGKMRDKGTCALLGLSG